MAVGRLAATALAATTITDVYQPTASTQSTFSVGVTNRNATNITIRLALSATTVTMANGEFIEYDTVVEPGRSLQITGLVLTNTHRLTARSSAANVDVVVWGIEETV